MPHYIQGAPPNIFPEGEYDFVVDEAKDKMSSTKNDMIELKLSVSDGNGESTTVFDNLVFTQAAYWKIDQFRAATGDTITPDKEIDFSAEDCEGRKGRVALFVGEYEGKKRNKVGAYIVSSSSSSETKKGKSTKNPF